MRGDQLARHWRAIRAIEASPNGLTVTEIAQREEMGIPTIYRGLDALHPPYHAKAQSAPSEIFGTLYPSFEVSLLKSQSVISNDSRARASRSQIVILKRGLNIKYPPYAFTEQGVAMLSSVLRSKRAVSVNIEIMRAFVRLRQMLAGNANLERQLNELEKKYDAQFKVVFEAIRQLMAPPAAGQKKIGFQLKEKRSPYLAKSRNGKGSNSVRWIRDA